MKKTTLISPLIAAFALFLLNNTIYAGTPLWTFSSPDPAILSVPINGTGMIQYEVCNQSQRPHRLVMKPIQGVAQGTPCSLNPKSMPGDCCTLVLRVIGNKLPPAGISAGPSLCQADPNDTPNLNQCYQPSQKNSLSIRRLAAAYTVGGTVSGLTGTVTLLNNGTNATPISTDGPFTFSTQIAEGSTYNVTVGTQPFNQTCTVANGTGIMGGTNLINVTVTCSANSYTVGGTVTGLTGTVTLLNNGTNPTPISINGPFTFSTSLALGSPYNVSVGTQSFGQYCLVANGSGTITGDVTNVSVSCTTQGNATLTVASTAVIPVIPAQTLQLTVNNTNNTNYAINVKATLPVQWTGVTQDFSDCTAIPPNGSCVLRFNSATPYVAQNITINGDNISSPPTTAIAFSIYGYLVYAVPTSSIAMLVENNDVALPKYWDSSNNCRNNFTCSQTNASSIFNGAYLDNTGDTYKIISGTNQIGIQAPLYNAASSCYIITSDNSGSVPVGTWFLPAICELGTANGGILNAGCGSTPNIESNLYNLGFLSNILGQYWSSAEYASDPVRVAWYEGFGGVNNNVQYVANKYEQRQVRCVRAVSY